MRHIDAMRQRSEPDKRDPNPTCEADLEAVSRGFWDDVSWTVCRCPACDIAIACVGGGAHWWNYVISPESRARLHV